MGTTFGDLPVMTADRLLTALREIDHPLPKAAADRIAELEAALRSIANDDATDPSTLEAMRMRAIARKALSVP